jgi:hypothetical protein
MIKAVAIFCGFVGFLTLMLAVAGLSQGGDVQARETVMSDDGCITQELALDEGYGVSRKLSQRICGK